MYHDRVVRPKITEATVTMRDTPLTSSISSVSANRARSEPLTIEPARFGDLRDVATLQKRSFPPRLAYRLPTLLLLRVLPNVQFVVAREGKRVLGCAIGDRHGGQSRVVNICVDPLSRRRGVATRLLRQLEASLPAGDIVLMAEIGNDAARALYRKEGYADLGVIRNYYGRGKDGIWMQKVRNPGTSRGGGT